MPVDQTMEADSVLSFRGSMWDCRARMLWQRLFNFYREQGCPLDHMDNMLIDLRNCDEAMALVGNGETVKFLWCCSPKAYMTSWIDQKNWFSGDPALTARWSSWDFVVVCELTQDEALFTHLDVSEQNSLPGDNQ